jgi:hypothetical protein
MKEPYIDGRGDLEAEPGLGWPESGVDGEGRPVSGGGEDEATSLEQEAVHRHLASQGSHNAAMDNTIHYIFILQITKHTTFLFKNDNYDQQIFIISHAETNLFVAQVERLMLSRRGSNQYL